MPRNSYPHMVLDQTVDRVRDIRAARRPRRARTRRGGTRIGRRRSAITGTQRDVGTLEVEIVVAPSVALFVVHDLNQLQGAVFAGDIGQRDLG